MTATATLPTPNIRTCARCGIAYDWRESVSRYLKMTYCNSLCERADLGFTIQGLLATERAIPELELAEESETVGTVEAVEAMLRAA